MAEPRRLLDQVRDGIRTRHFSRRTERAYIQWIRRFILFHNRRHPSGMGEEEIGDFLSALATKDKVSASTQNQALAALLFLFRDVLGRPVAQLEKSSAPDRRSAYRSCSLDPR